MPTNLFNDIFRQPWLIEPQTAAAQRQVLQGLLMGLQFAPENDTVQAAITHKESPKVPKGRKVNVVELTGTMFRDDGPCGLVGTRSLASLLREADAEDNVLGHILYIDSGGGCANSVPDLAEAIQGCNKPVVGFVDGYMCSAAMYAGSYCQHIIANREDNRVGCIGTVIELDDYPRQAKDANGIVHLRVYADGAEDKNSEYEEALEGNFKLIKERILNPLNERFKADIRANRQAVKEDQLTGRTYYANEAVGTLIDAIGNFDTAVAKVIELSNINITKMEGLEHLQAIPGCANLEMVDDTVSLNKEQLEAINTAIQTEKGLVSTANTTITEQTQRIAQLKKDLASEKTDNENKATEIAGLKATIEELNTRPTPPAAALHNGDHLNEKALPFADDPEAYCNDLLKRMGDK